jgi:hypothetical protein
MVETKIRKAEVEEVGSDYPYLGEYKGVGGAFTVFFFKDSTGVILSSEDDANPVGTFDEEWDEDDFKRLHSDHILEIRNRN